jgi:hypothetical protein
VIRAALGVQGPRWRRAGDGETESCRPRLEAPALTRAVESAGAVGGVGAKRLMEPWAP